MSTILRRIHQIVDYYNINKQHQQTTTTNNINKQQQQTTTTNSAYSKPERESLYICVF
jgi:hypothetical protein